MVGLAPCAFHRVFNDKWYTRCKGVPVLSCLELVPPPVAGSQEAGELLDTSLILENPFLLANLGWLMPTVGPPRRNQHTSDLLTLESRCPVATGYLGAPLSQVVSGQWSGKLLWLGTRTKRLWHSLSGGYSGDSGLVSITSTIAVGHFAATSAERMLRPQSWRNTWERSVH